MSVLTRRSGGVTQRGASQLWREGVRPDKGHYGFDPADSSVFPKWYTPLNADFYKVAKDEAVLRDRLCGVRKHPGKYAAAGKGKLNNWTMVCAANPTKSPPPPLPHGKKGTPQTATRTQ